MGIKDFNPLLREICPSVFRSFHISELKGMRVAIDGSLLFMKYWSPSLDQVLDQTDFTQGEIDHDQILRIWISKIFVILTDLVKEGIVPIIIFDGQPPKLKMIYAKKDRTKKSQDARARLAEIFADVQGLPPLYRMAQLTEKIPEIKKL